MHKINIEAIEPGESEPEGAIKEVNTQQEKTQEEK
jgi:hypothetical protein